MLRSTRILVPVAAAAILAACEESLLAPTPRIAASSAAARATGSTFSAWPVSASQITMSWPDDAKNELGWEVHRSTTGASGSFSLLASLPANSTGYTNSDLAPLTQYCYKARSFKKSGPNTTYAAFTNVACGTTYGPPAAPSATYAYPRASTSVDVRWTDNATSEQAFRIERSADPGGPWTSAGTAAANTTTFTDSQRLPEELVCYRVIATNSFGESAPSSAGCTTPPAKPANVTAVSVDASSIDVGWTDASNVEDGYSVERSLDGVNFGAIAQLPLNVTSYHDGSVTPDTRYWYRVRAKKDGGFSDSSDPVWAAAASKAPTPPALYGVAPGNSTTAAVQWFNVGATTTGIRIERSTDNQASWVTAGVMAAGGDTRFWDDGRTPESLVCYRVVATNAFGESAPSNVDCTVPPAGPTNMVRDVYALYWTDNSNVEERYEIWFTYCYSEDECYWGVRSVEANSTVAGLEEWEVFSELYAYSDGGYSNPGTWAATNAQVRASTALPLRPTKGARAPRPAVARIVLRPRSP